MKKNIFKKALAWVTCAAMITAGGTFAFAEDLSGDAGSELLNTFIPTLTGTLTTGADTTSSPDQTVNTTDEIDNSSQNLSLDNDGSDISESPAAEEKKVETTAKQTVDFSKFEDVSNHWAKANLKRAVEDGLLNGFSDNTLRPNAEITLAQMITIITRILKPELTGNSGAPAGSWYKEAADKAVGLGLITIRNASSLNSATTRQEACAMIAEAFQLKTGDPNKKAGNSYKDYAGLSSSEKLIFAALIEGGYIQGYNGSLMLTNSITRAEFVTILYRIADSYIDAEDLSSAAISTGAVVSGDSLDLDGTVFTKKIWTDATAETVNIENSSLSSLTLRSDSLTSLTVDNSDIDRLCIAARSGNVDLNCQGIDTTVVGSGSGNVILDPAGNSVEITGDSRIVELNGPSSKVSISGSNNIITVNTGADIKSLVINGTGNVIRINSAVSTLSMYGKSNTVKGDGVADTVVLYTGKSSISIQTGETIDKIDNGISDMTVTLYGPGTISFNQYFKVNSTLTGDVPEGTAVTYTWTLGGKEVKTGTLTLSASNPPTLNYYFSYTGSVSDTLAVGLKLEYTTTDGEYQVLEAKGTTVKPDKSSAAYVQSLVNTVTTTYKGNNTTQWAIDHDYSTLVKETFVNYKGYSSSSQYLIWVNIGTQHCNVFQGSKGKWKLIRSGLVATGAGDCTPRGVFKTTYKQTDWTTTTYTVKPIVRFYGGGYALHSRLYYPGTSSLKPGTSNGVGYPLSHGCVRMQADDINWIYKNIPNGTTVVVY